MIASKRLGRTEHYAATLTGAVLGRGCAIKALDDTWLSLELL